MPASFLTLPAEVRNEIYGYLLSTECNIFLSSDYRPKTRRRTIILSPGLHVFSCCWRYGLHPALLWTCRKIHDEAHALLYAHKTFLYSFRDTDENFYERYKPNPFPKRSLQMIENLKLVVNEGHTEEATSDHILQVVALFANSDCSLKRLILDFGLKNHYDSEDSEDSESEFEPSSNIRPVANDQRILDAINAITSLQNITISVCHICRDSRVFFETFVNADMSSKGWICDDDEEKRTSYFRTWHIRPA